MKRYKVIIPKRGNIPGIGVGPFMRPLAISEAQYKSLIKLGYKVKIVEDLFAKAKKITSNMVSQPKEEKPIIIEEKIEIKEEIKKSTPKKENKKVEEPVVEEVKEVKVEEPVEEAEEVTEEVNEEANEEEGILVDDPDLKGESYYNSEFLTSKNICKKILNARMVQYESNASLRVLKQLVIDSNPEIVTEESNN